MGWRREPGAWLISEEVISKVRGEDLVGNRFDFLDESFCLSDGK